MLIGHRVIVIGAGIAGLAVARALSLRGAQVTVLEQAPEIREVGAGLQISPNGARVIRALGLGESLDRIGPPLGAVKLIDGHTGRGLVRLPFGDGRHGLGFHFVHRADLIDLLAAGARTVGVEIRTATKVARVVPGAPALAETDAGETLRADLVIGADGLHSVVREVLNGRVAPFFARQVAWRATLPAERDIPPEALVYLGPGRHLVTYPLRGGALRNIVAVEERSRWAEESWSVTDDPAALRAAFQSFVPEVRGWLDRIERPNLWGLFRHPVAERWHGEGIAILGDAAHPTLPFLAQGANMALEDAWVLAETLASHQTAEEALVAYQTIRRHRTERIVAAANANARNYHLTGLQRGAAHLGLRTVGRLFPRALLSRFDWLYGYDATGGQGG